MFLFCLFREVRKAQFKTRPIVTELFLKTMDALFSFCV